MRKNEISFLNVLFCILVIFIHITSAPVSTLDRGGAVWTAFFVPWRLSAFVVQGFIFLSAVKMYLKPIQRTDYPRYYMTRLKKIVLPYVAANLLFYCYFVSKGYFPFSVSDFARYVVKGDMVAHFYFVVIIVQFYLLKPVWDFAVEHTKNRPPAKGLILALSLMVSLLSSGALFPKLRFAYSDRIFTTYAVYWVWGMFAGAEYAGFTEKIGRRRSLCVIFPAVAAAEAYTAWRCFNGEAVVYAEGMHFLYCICAISFFFAVGTRFAGRAADFGLFKRLDGASYYIYLLHPLFIFTVDEAMVSCGLYGTRSTFAVRAAVTYIGSAVAAIGYVGLKKYLREVHYVKIQKSKNRRQG